MSKHSNLSSLLRNRGFLNLWTNQILVQLAYNSLNFALIIWVFKLLDSNTAVSFLIFAIYLPAVIFGLFAGIFVDLLDRKKIIIATNLFLVLLFFSLIFFKGYFLVILTVAFLVNTLAQFYMPSESSAIPIIVKKEQLFLANSLFSTTLFTSFLLGFGLSGPLINMFNIDTVFWLGGVLLIVAFILSFKLPSITTKPNKSSIKLIKAWLNKDIKEFKQLGEQEVKETLTLIRGKLPVLVSIGILSGVQAVIAVTGVIIPAFLERALQINATDGSFILVAPLGLGMIVGGVLVGKYGYLIPRRRLASIAIILGGLLLFTVGAAPLFSPAIQYLPKPRPLPFTYQPPLSTILIIGSFLLGISLVSTIIPSQTVLQENTPEQSRGKVFSVLGTFMSALALIPALIAGIVADGIGTTSIFIALGGTIAILGLLGLKPDFFFEERHLSFRVRQFLGLGHWRKKRKK